MADPFDWYRSALGGDVGTGIPLNLDRTPVPDTGQGTAWSHLQQAPGDILQSVLGLLERGQLGGLNALGLRSPGSDIYRAQIPVEPGLRAAEGAATFATGGLASSLFPAAGALKAGAQYAVPPGTMPGLLADEMGGIRAFHGSPHDFDRFDLSKIGTGEGAQAYGHGLYFAENERVARGYRDTLAVGHVRAPGSEVNLSEDPLLGKAARHLYNANGDYDLAAKRIRQLAPDAEGALQQLKEVGAAPFPGRMYEVDINADPKAFLDWDKPLAAQPDVQRILAEAKVINPRSEFPEVLARANQQTGGEIYESPKLVPGGYRDPQAASAALRELGVPGIKYLDQGSRFNPAALPDNPIANEAREFLKTANGDSAAALQAFKDSDPVSRWGATERDEIRKVLEAAARPITSNYAVFDDSLVQILRKYGLLPPVAGAGLMGSGDNQ